MAEKEQFYRSLVLQALEGDSEATERLVSLFHDDLMATLYVLGVPHSDIDDLAVEIALEILRSLSRFDLQREFIPWMRTIIRRRVKNYWRDSIRAHKRIEKYRELLAQELEHSMMESGEDRSHTINRLRECLTKLSDEQRELVQMRYFLNLNSNEIAQKLDKTAVAIRKTLSRLREVLEGCVRRGIA